jgi:hypothetical protein
MEGLAMNSKVQPQASSADELASERATRIIGLAVAAVFVAMMVLNAISY